VQRCRTIRRSIQTTRGGPTQRGRDQARPAVPRIPIIGPIRSSTRAAALDAGADELGEGELPRSKSGAPYAPPSFSAAPPLSFEPPGWLDIAHLLSPNIVDYFTKTLPPAPPFPATPGKIPSTDNPYAGAAALEAAAFLLAPLEGRIVGSLAGRLANLAEKTTANTLVNSAVQPTIQNVLDAAARLRLNVELGRLGEEAVGIPAHVPKSGIKIVESGITRYPDRLTRTTIEEVKNVGYLALTGQLRDYLAHAENNGLTFILHVRPKIEYSRPLQRLIDAGRIIPKDIPAPTK
jgi:hypothetical protein